ncbi:MAG TPA: hypothetical protein VHE61_16505 [Opitutaceae bacterium]|nr:hypothetical protein [Opitutaceae bacterium]
MNRLSRSPKCLVPLALSWSHAGADYRAMPWPDLRIERRCGDEWLPFNPSLAALRAAAAELSPGAWRSFLEFVPTGVREFVGQFQSNRLAALVVAARCPDLVGTLAECPALTAFAAAHVTLRGTEGPRWNELNAQYERGGAFAVLEWLGLPASRDSLAILRNLVAPDLAPALLGSLRTILWKPEGIFALARLPAIGQRELSDACALAA